MFACVPTRRDIEEFTVKRNPAVVKYVARASVLTQNFLYTRDLIPMRNHRNVKTGKAFPTLIPYSTQVISYWGSVHV